MCGRKLPVAPLLAWRALGWDEIDTTQQRAVDGLVTGRAQEELFRPRRAARDLHIRSARAAPFYVVVSVAFTLTTGSPALLSWQAWVPTALFGLLGALRIVHKPPREGAAAAAYRHWRWRHWLLIDASCLLWSSHLLQAGMLGPSYFLSLMLALLGVAVCSAAVCYTYAMDRQPALLALACLNLPGALAFATPFPESMPIALGLLLHGGFAVFMLDRAARDYDAQIGTEHALILARTEADRLVRIDSLTGLANRREYERHFKQAWHMAARQRADLALLVIDLDKFKQVNDSLGHSAGDACLRHFAEILLQHFRRSGDLAARIGGEEFAVVLPGVTAAEAIRMGEEFRDLLAKSCCHYRQQAIHITASIGAGTADWSVDFEPGDTFARVDEACYQAKKQGRSRLVAV